MNLSKKLISVLGLCALLMANYTAALGLGDLELQSTLNEPFSADVKLLDVGSFSASEIIVGFAPAEEFDRRQLERHFFYNEFRFKVSMDGEKGPMVHISSSKLMQEPFLSFILEVRGPNGRFMREYTVLLDKPRAIVAE